MAAQELGFAIIFLFAFGIGIGHCQAACTLSDIKVTQDGTRVQIQGKPEYKVTVTNVCICSQSELELQCTGFQSLEGVDPAVFRVDGDKCLLNNGVPLHGSESINFKYAWDTKFNLVPLSSEINCS